MRKLLILIIVLTGLFAARKQLLDALFGKEDEFVYSASGQA
jgi:hypothetical protein